MSSFNISRFISTGSRPKHTFKKVASNSINYIDDMNGEENSTKKVGEKVNENDITIINSEQKHEGSIFVLGQIISQNELALAQSNTKYDIFDEFLELDMRGKSVNKAKNDLKIKKKRGVAAENNTVSVNNKNGNNKRGIENDNVDFVRKEITRRALKDKSNKKNDGMNQKNEVFVRSTLVSEKIQDNEVSQKNKNREEKRVDFKIYDDNVEHDNSELVINSVTEPDELQEQDYLNDTYISEDWRNMKPIMTSTPVKVIDNSHILPSHHIDKESSTTSLEEIGNILLSDDDAENKKSLKNSNTSDSQNKTEKQSVRSLELKGDQNIQENLDYDPSPDPLTLPMRPGDQRLPPPPKGGYQIIKKILNRPITPTSEEKKADLSRGPPWRNRLARSAVNRKDPGSNPGGGDKIVDCVRRLNAT
ncbi:11326_t:CDS:2 [Scutellospora calospora]|uniref:11326_t:CDS:1 n=1 Tax=Scutellospora calospora TaxID=85575 RepID=A0ACA9KVM3_9GLOM|nr:11326_t:CDS:2 [Scutellospora calospora]